MFQKLFAAAGGAVFLIICFATLSPIELRPETDHVTFERFGAFALLGLFAALAFPKRIVPVAVVVVLCAFGLEAAQLVVPTRHGQLPDAVIKAIGGACGVIVARLAIWTHDRKQSSLLTKS